MQCTTQTQYPNPAGVITKYPDPVPGWKTAPGYALLIAVTENQHQKRIYKLKIKNPIL